MDSGKIANSLLIIAPSLLKQSNSTCRKTGLQNATVLLKMAAKSIIDSLPKEKRQKVLNMLLQGKSLRAVALVAGVAHTSVQDYKRKVVMPAIKQAQQLQQYQPLPETGLESVRQQTSLTRDLVTGSVFRERLEGLWQRADRSLTQAEANQELTVMAPLLNQAHKNVELLGRATGELESATASVIAIQIVCPAGAELPPAAPSCQVIDVAASR